MNRSRISPGPSRRNVRGVTLVELMVGLLLGLMVTGAAIAMFVSNRMTYQATETLGRVQENARIAFELMARDLREAAGNPCVNNLPLVNVLNSPGSNWFTDINGWNTALLGAEGDFPAAGAQPANRVAGTDAVQIMSAADRVFTVSAHDIASHTFTLNANHGFSSGDLILVCNARQASIFQSSAASGNTIRHASGGTAPGNCTGELGLPQNCTAGTPFAYAAPNTVIARLHATRWYVGTNGRGGNSLYQSRLQGGAVVNEEIAENVVGLQMTYLQAGQNSYLPASGITDWGRVLAARIHLQMQGVEQVGGSPVVRDMIYIAALRNRNT